MARPQKQTVDYFPHQISDGKTKLILQNEFGNDGYAFWFKLLELLCSSENQVYDYNNPASWRLLLAKTHVTDDIAIKILQLLADLETIDPELHKSGIIWSQNLIDNLELVYRRRATGIPKKPVITNKKPVNVNNKPQTIQYNTKQNKTKEYISFPEYPNIKMSSEEHQKLVDKFGRNGCNEKVGTLSLYIESKGVKYKSHYATILAWDLREQKEGRQKHAAPTGYTAKRVPQSYTDPKDV